MCCCKQKCCKITLAIFAAAAFIMGIVIIILGVKLKNSEVFRNGERDETVRKVGDAAFYIMIIFACLAVVAGILGLCTAKFNKCFCIGCFAFWSFIIGLLFLAAGVILFVIGTASETMVKEFCAGTGDYSKYFADTIADIDDAMMNTTA